MTMIVVSEKVIITGFYRNLRQHLNKCEHNGVKWRYIIKKGDI